MIHLLIGLFTLACQVDAGNLPGDPIWLHTLEEAKEQAGKEGKNILMYFSGSDWCKPCILLKQEILETEEFQAYANEHLVMLQVDFPRKKKNRLSAEQMKANEALAEKYNLQGAFPLVVLLTPDEKVLGNNGYQRISASEYVDQIRSILN